MSRLDEIRAREAASYEHTGGHDWECRWCGGNQAYGEHKADCPRADLPALLAVATAAAAVCNHLEPDGMLRVTNIVTDMRALCAALDALEAGR